MTKNEARISELKIEAEDTYKNIKDEIYYLAKKLKEKDNTQEDIEEIFFRLNMLYKVLEHVMDTLLEESLLESKEISKDKKIILASTNFSLACSLINIYFVPMLAPMWFAIAGLSYYYASSSNDRYAYRTGLRIQNRLEEYSRIEDEIKKNREVAKELLSKYPEYFFLTKEAEQDNLIFLANSIIGDYINEDIYPDKIDDIVKTTIISLLQSDLDTDETDLRTLLNKAKEETKKEETKKEL